MAVRTKEARDEADRALREIEEEALNARLNHSERLMHRKIGATRLRVLIVQFRAAARKDPALLTKLYKQRDPYRWLAEQWAPTARQLVPVSRLEAELVSLCPETPSPGGSLRKEQTGAHASAGRSQPRPKQRVMAGS
jgi:hypothetical protein